MLYLLGYDLTWPTRSLWPFSAENLFFISRLSRPAGRSKRIFTKGDAMESCILSGRWVGSFSEDRPLGWDPVAEGNRAGDGMACNSNDRRQWRKQEVAVGTAASRMRVLLKARSIRWVPQPVLVSEEKATDTLAVKQFTSGSSADASCRPRSGRGRRPHPRGCYRRRRTPGSPYRWPAGRGP